MSQFFNTTTEEDRGGVKTPATSASTIKISRSQWGESEFDQLFQTGGGGAISPKTAYKASRTELPHSPTESGRSLLAASLKQSDGFSSRRSLARALRPTTGTIVTISKNPSATSIEAREELKRA